MNFYPHHIGDFNNATRHLTRIERSVYRDLLELYYDTEQPLPLDSKVLCRKIIARSDEEATAVEQVLNEFFTKTEQGWYQERCEKEIARYHWNIEAKTAAGRASAAKRAERASSNQHPLHDKPTEVQQPFNGRSTNQEPEPITINQEPVTKNQEPDSLTQKPKTLPVAIASGPEKKQALDLLEAGRNVWASYSNAFFLRYQTEPVQNAKVRSIIKQFVQRIGVGEASDVAAFYVSHNDKFYIQKTHPAELMLKDAEGLRTQWATGRTMTASRATQQDRTATNAESVKEAIEMMNRRQHHATG